MTMLANALEEQTFQGKLLQLEPLADYTTWRVGGPAKFIYKPNGLMDLINFLPHIEAHEPILWLGLGSNSLIRDGGFPGVVILTQNCLNEIELIQENQIRVEAGVSCAKMARFCARNNLSGGEFWAGIPGTMGGALRMNAGCYNGETWNFVTEVETINRKGELRKRTPESFQVSYRHVEGLAAEEWFVAATCQLPAGEKEQSLQIIKELLARRAETQPTNEFNCGSVFRNPPQQHAAKLIESCGLKAQRVGGAVVSPKHANFIVNYQGTAKAQDIEQLIELVQKTVFEQTGMNLVREVIYIGEQ
jgi:UDP-N-acetylmuramate dehydrogenase